MKDIRYNSGTAWESSVNYSRAVRRGSWVGVSGTTAMDGEQLIGPGDASAQAQFVFEKIKRSLSEVGASLQDVVRTRMYIVNPDDATAVTAAHADFFADIHPCATLLVVAGLIDSELLVEIEVDAILDESTS